MFIAAAGCAFAAILISIGSREITRATESTLIYLLLAAIGFTGAGFIARFIDGQRWMTLRKSASMVVEARQPLLLQARIGLVAYLLSYLKRSCL